MSRSNPQLTNPAGRWFEWSGSTGILSFYDKEKKQSINVPVPFSFLPLDQLSTISGYDKAEKSGFWANEVRNITKDELIVRSKSGIRSQGTYKNAQGVVQMPRGANYTKSIYIAYETRDGWQIGNLKVHGSALTAWIEFSKSVVPENGKVTMTKDNAQAGQMGDFFPPVFTYGHCTDEENAIAMKLDRDLQVYLESYLKQPPITDYESEMVNGTTTDTLATDAEVAEYEAKKQAAGMTVDPVETYQRVATAERDTVADMPPEGEPINLDEIPF